MRIAALFVIVGLGVAGCAGPANKLADNMQYPTVCRVADTPRCAEELARAQQQWATGVEQQSPQEAGPRDQSAAQPRPWVAGPEAVASVNGHGPLPLQEAIAAPLPSPVFPRVNAMISTPADGRNSPSGQHVDVRAAGPR
jgi:hypothetical protein